MPRSEFNWLWIGAVGGLLWTLRWTLGLHKTGASWENISYSVPRNEVLMRNANTAHAGFCLHLWWQREFVGNRSRWPILSRQSAGDTSFEHLDIPAPTNV
jgi:hypothetical protein